MAEWQNGRMAEWQYGRMAEQRNGGMGMMQCRMAEWRDGGMAEWRNGGMVFTTYLIYLAIFMVQDDDANNNAANDANDTNGF